MTRTFFIPNGYSNENGKVLCPVCGSQFQQAIPAENSWKCRCGALLQKADAVYQVTMRLTNNKITMTLPREDEQIEFHFHRGRVVFRCKNTPHPMDVTEHPDLWQDSHCYAVLQSAKARQAFHDFLQGGIWYLTDVPYSPEFLTPERMILLTRFIGYPKSFYQDLPVMDNAIPTPFKKMGQRLHCSRKRLKVIRSLNTGWSRSCEEILYQQPALLFYHKQLDLIFDALGNVKQFAALLRTPKPELFHHLAFLESFPRACAFIADYLHAAGFERYKQLVSYPDLLEPYAVAYVCMNKRMRSAAQKRFREEPFHPDRAIAYSLPVKTVLPDCTVNTDTGSFRFTAPKNTREHALLKAAGNGLPDWDAVCHGTSVIGIRHGDAVIGAVEVAEQSILNVSMNAQALEAFDLWKRFLNLTDETEHGEEDDLDFCF